MRRPVSIQRALSVFLLLFFSASCAILPGNWRPGRNSPLEEKGKAKPKAPTHANFFIGEKEREDDLFIGLALSGGGSRAANFGAAVMLELQKKGILERVDFISSVSGGSLPAAYYALEGYNGISFTEEEVKDRMGRDFQNRWIGRWFLPQNIFRYWLTNFTRSDIMVQVFENNLYHGATFADLNPKRPKLLINATDRGKGTRFTFSEEMFDELGSDLRSYRIASAVNVSSAFPGVFHDVALQDFKSSGAESPAYLHLFDGGPIDNLGIRSLWSFELPSALAEAVGPDGTFKRHFQRCVLISVDASPDRIDPDRHRLDNRKFIDYFVDRNALEASDVMLLRIRGDLLEGIGMVSPREIDKDVFSDFDLYDQPENRCHVWHIALRHLLRIPEIKPLAERATNIATKFNITPEEQNDLFEAARILVEEGLKNGAEKWFEPEKISR